MPLRYMLPLPEVRASISPASLQTREILPLPLVEALILSAVIISTSMSPLPVVVNSADLDLMPEISISPLPLVDAEKDLHVTSPFISMSPLPLVDHLKPSSAEIGLLMVQSPEPESFTEFRTGELTVRTVFTRGVRLMMPGCVSTTRVFPLTSIR